MQFLHGPYALNALDALAYKSDIYLKLKCARRPMGRVSLSPTHGDGYEKYKTLGSIDNCITPSALANCDGRYLHSCVEQPGAGTT